MKRITLLVVVLCIGLLGLAAAQVQVEDLGASPQGTQSTYYSINATGNPGPWPLDSAQIDTSIYVRITPGLFWTVKAVCAAAADTITQTYIYRNTVPSTVGMQLIDSLGVVGGTTTVWRDLHGTAATGVKNVVMARYLIFIPTSDTGAGADASSFSVELFSSKNP